MNIVYVYAQRHQCTCICPKETVYMYMPKQTIVHAYMYILKGNIIYPKETFYMYTPKGNILLAPALGQNTDQS